MKFSGLICDLDGTLLDSIADLGESMNTVLAADGLPRHPISAYRLLVGDGVEMLAERSLPPRLRSPGMVTEMARRMREVYSGRWGVHTRPYEGIEEMLAQAHQAGVTLAVLSNKVDDFTRDMISHFFPQVPFAQVVGAKKGVPNKPNPQSAQKLAQDIGLEPEKCIFLGDTKVDMETAVGAGMFPVGVLWGFRDEKELNGAGAKRLLAHPSDLAELLA
ncbi:MAG: HAD family hydrolase [Desulfarculaceae bacterium]|nr:HAD family hydrolase [Desulfarculaceae bacterium]MCF8046912.1 HAD family hydrolase [Desulfarculaceae bacterium]MCF8063897.1 HAD family hydrolase [Desulfarculaceae bacterium]MCF8099112.1 HAD family hydrolase [Desulfarculaceae bacterium]MCF8121200.1 HAD family hydrolase [Desulfarculaceae bacterium]